MTSELINKHILKIQLGVAISFILTMVFFVYRFSVFVFMAENTEARVVKLETKIDTLATKDDIKFLKDDLKDYINKK